MGVDVAPVDELAISEPRHRVQRRRLEPLAEDDDGVGHVRERQIGDLVLDHEHRAHRERQSGELVDPHRELAQAGRQLLDGRQDPEPHVARDGPEAEAGVEAGGRGVDPFRGQHLLEQPAEQPAVPFHELRVNAGQVELAQVDRRGVGAVDPVDDVEHRQPVSRDLEDVHRVRRHPRHELRSPLGGQGEQSIERRDLTGPTHEHGELLDGVDHDEAGYIVVTQGSAPHRPILDPTPRTRPSAGGPGPHAVDPLNGLARPFEQIRGGRTDEADPHRLPR